MGVDLEPGVAVDEVHAAVGEQVAHGLRVRLGGLGQRAGLELGGKLPHGLHRAGTVGADHPGRPALDPARGEQARQVLPARRVENPAGVVGDGRRIVVEGHILQGGRAVADRAIDRLDLQVLCAPAAADPPAGALGTGDGLGDLQSKTGHPAIVTQDLDGGPAEAEPHHPLPGGESGGLGLIRRTVPGLTLCLGPFLELRAHLPHPAITVAEGARLVVVVLQVGRVHHDRDALHLGHLPQLQGRELGVHGAAAADHRHHPGRVGAEPGADVLGDVGGLQLLGAAHQHACHVQGDVADAHHGRALGGQRPLGVRIRVAVVPGHELGGPVRPLEVLARDAEPTVRERPRGEDDRVVEAVHVVQGEVAAELDVAEEPDARVGGDPLQRAGDALDAGVVGGHAVPQQTVGDREPVDEVHHDPASGGIPIVTPVQQCFAGVHPRRPGAHDGHTERGLCDGRHVRDRRTEKRAGYLDPADRSSGEHNRHP